MPSTAPHPSLRILRFERSRNAIGKRLSVASFPANVSQVRDPTSDSYVWALLWRTASWRSRGIVRGAEQCPVPIRTLIGFRVRQNPRPEAICGNCKAQLRARSDESRMKGRINPEEMREVIKTRVDNMITTNHSRVCSGSGVV